LADRGPPARRRDGHISGLNKLKSHGIEAGGRPVLAIDQLRARRKMPM